MWLGCLSFNLDTPFNFVTNNDIIGGNSGSTIVNQKGEVVGLVFEGNIHFLGGEFGFDARLNRTVAVHSQALLEALDKIYPAGTSPQRFGGRSDNSTASVLQYRNLLCCAMNRSPIRPCCRFQKESRLR